MMILPISIIELDNFLGSKINASMRLSIIQFISSNAVLNEGILVWWRREPQGWLGFKIV
jgi:hypothetical protein